MSLPPEKWMPGMPIIRIVDGCRWIYAGGTRATNERNGIDGIIDMDASLFRRYRPASYADLGREAREGDVAVLLTTKTGISGCAIGDVVEVIGDRRMRSTADSWEMLREAAFEYQWLAPLDAAIYAASRETEKPLTCEDCVTEKDVAPHGSINLCTGCWKARMAQAEIKRSTREVTQAHDEPAPAPSECLRVAAARREAGHDFAVHCSKANNESLVRGCVEVAEKWEPRLSEFEPCGDCPACLAEADRREWEAAIEQRVSEPIGDSAAQFHGEMQERAMKRRTHENLRRFFGGGR